MSENNLEKEIKEIEESIDDLKMFSKDRIIDVSEELAELKNKLKKLQKKASENYTPWDRIEIARNPSRPTSLDYIEKIFDEFIELHGDRISKDDKAIVCGLARIGNQAYTVIGEQKGRNTKENIERNFGMPNPESYRKSLRFMKQAEKFKRPIITFIDTKGAYPGIDAEKRGQGEAIARNMFEMARLKVPVICFVIGEGSSGGALALGVGNRIIMLENSVYSILSPEGYASILWKDSTRAKEAAEKMKLTSYDLLEFEVIDKVLKEPIGGATKNLNEMCKAMKKEILEATKELIVLDKDELIEKRYQKFRKMGEYEKII